MINNKNYYNKWTEIVFEKEYYHRKAIMLAANNFSDIFCSKLVSKNDIKTSLFLKPKKILTDEEFEIYYHEIINEVLDMQIRCELKKENSKIHELIVEQAFKPIENIQSKYNDNK